MLQGGLPQPLPSFSLRVPVDDRRASGLRRALGCNRLTHRACRRRGTVWCCDYPMGTGRQVRQVGSPDPSWGTLVNPCPLFVAKMPCSSAYVYWPGRAGLGLEGAGRHGHPSPGQPCMLLPSSLPCLPRLFDLLPALSRLLTLLSATVPLCNTHHRHHPPFPCLPFTPCRIGPNTGRAHLPCPPQHGL